jgi:excisionase family DNA binding protein
VAGSPLSRREPPLGGEPRRGSNGLLRQVEVMNMDQRLLLRAEEVRMLLGIGRSKVFEMMARGELPVVRMGRSVRVPREALEQWIADRTGGGAPR